MIFAGATIFISLNISSKADDAGIDLDTVAKDALRSALTTTGSPITWNSATDSSTLQRLGLVESGKTSTMDFSKIQALDSWVGDTSAYEDVRSAMGLSNYDFHLRTYPVFEKTGPTTITGLETYRVAYVGHYDGAESAASASESAALATIDINFTNAYHDHTDPLGYGDKWQDMYDLSASKLSTRLAGAYGATDVDPTGRAQWRPVRTAGTHFAAEERVFTSSFMPGNWFTTEDVELDRLYLTEVNLTAHDTSAATTLTLRHWLRGQNAADESYAQVQVACTDCGDPSLVWEDATAKMYATGAGGYTFESLDVDLSSWNGKTMAVGLLWVTDQAPDDDEHFGWFVAAATVSTLDAGATTTHYTNDLDYETTRYDTVIIGSDTIQATMFKDITPPYYNDDHLIEAIQDWVLAGGNIVALGTTYMDQAWLEPALTSGSPTPYNGALVVGRSDLTHPILTTPFNLNHRYYTGSLQTYSGGPTYHDIIVHQKDQTTDVPILTYSGASFDGKVVLTAWKPYNMTETERERFLVNTLTYVKFEDLFVDFGATITRDSAIGSATKTVLLNAESLGVGTLQLGITLYVWE